MHLGLRHDHASVSVVSPIQDRHPYLMSRARAVTKREHVNSALLSERPATIHSLAFCCRAQLAVSQPFALLVGLISSAVLCRSRKMFVNSQLIRVRVRALPWPCRRASASSLTREKIRNSEMETMQDNYMYAMGALVSTRVTGAIPSRRSRCRLLHQREFSASL